MKNTILTIALPVYNEIDYLPKVLQSIDEQTNESNRDLFEVLISDNDSSDGTVEYLRNLDVRFHLRINFNNENIGADANFNFVVTEARSEHVWLLGGQDYPVDGSIKKIISIIESANPELLLLNYVIYNESDGKEMRNTAYDHISSDTFTSLYKFFICTGGPGLAMSSNVFKKKIYLDGLARGGVSKNWAHIESLYSGLFAASELRRNDKIYAVIRTPMFTLFREKNGWWTTELVLENYLNLIEIGIHRIKNPFLNLRIRHRRSGLELKKSILLHSTNGRKIEFSDLKRIIGMCWLIPEFWLIAFPSLLKRISIWKLWS